MLHIYIYDISSLRVNDLKYPTSYCFLTLKLRVTYTINRIWFLFATLQRGSEFLFLLDGRHVRIDPYLPAVPIHVQIRSELVYVRRKVEGYK